MLCYALQCGNVHANCFFINSTAIATTTKKAECIECNNKNNDCIARRHYWRAVPVTAAATANYALAACGMRQTASGKRPVARDLTQ